jgi:DNA-binding NtrC family response regulator
MNKILIIDDDEQLSKSFAKILDQEGYAVERALSGEEGLHQAETRRPDLVVLDVRLPGMSGIKTLELIHERDPKLPVIIFTAYGTTETAIEAMKIGAFDYIYKPFDVPEMLKTIASGLEAGRFMAVPVDMDPEPAQVQREAIIGRSAAMLEVYKAIGRVASTDATVLIRGESGTGKELAARAIYQHSKRSSRPFMVINCVAIPENLLESELFGYEKGAFTGAVHRRVGKIEQANHGTIFLDEIGDMPLSIQSKLLRLLQERSIERLGGREVIPVDVRILAATNRDLEQAVAEGRFREDLYYRLKVVTVFMPPLRDRLEDIPLLTDYLLGRFSREMGMDNPGINSEAIQVLQTYRWPGNIRELANTLQKSLIFNRGMPIQSEDISFPVHKKERPERMQDVEHFVHQWIQEMFKDKQDKVFDTCMDQFSSLVIKEALSKTKGNRSQAAKILGMSRPTLHSKMEKLGITVESTVNGN